jgi:RNA polymerase sigma factor (sigma-70 family)
MHHSYQDAQARGRKEYTVDMTPAEQAVEELIQKYYKLVFQTIYGLTGNWEESQDLTQDTFHRALKAIDAARAASGTQFREKAWLLGIALNTVRMQHRRRNLFRFIPFSGMQKGPQQASGEEFGDEALAERAAPVQPAGYGAGSAHDPAELIAERDTIQRTMARLSGPLRECLILAIIGNFSSSEIAHMLDLQEAAVRQRLARARKQFQHLYTLESGGQIDGDEIAAASAVKTSRQNARRQNYDERVECRAEAAATSSLLDHQPFISRRNYAEGLS